MSSGSEISAGFEAVRTSAVVSPLDSRALLVVTGEDRTTFLQGMLSNEVVSLAPGQGTPALLLTEQGRVVADLRVYVLEDRVWLDTPTEARNDVRAALERFIVADDVEMEESDLAGVVVRGPRAIECAGEAGAVVGALSECGHESVHVAGAEARAVRLLDLGVDAVHFWAKPDARGAIEKALTESGAATIPDEALEVQRVVAGIGRLGTEFGLDTLAPEVPSLESAISYKKGCYLGQEVVERIASRGKVNWKIGVLRCGGAVAVGDTVRDPDGDVGRVTSVTSRPDDESTWVLARVRTTHSEVGTALAVSHGEETVSAEVVAPAPQ